MPGTIIGIVGPQRSGKTLLSYLIARYFYQASDPDERLRVYSNLYSPKDDFIHVDSISHIPLDLSPKVVLIDEIYNGLDAQDYKQLKDVSIFLNTIGKQNCLFMFTTIKASMVYNRVRDQMDYIILVKSSGDRIYYKIVNLNNCHERVFSLLKTPELFAAVNYDTNYIPPVFDWNMKNWELKLKSYYMTYF